ncbi:hypothetical protein MSHRCOH1_05235 [Candidatus Ornithobacterium hominis]|uniref:hypothetical protein n=1 Tax=Candidatus Ornithobacterium hominis TaxID=2497989 RepID=UPI0024BC7F9C|nr:hypothetical protein [Candidatus Ornithobacterium hominis]CAI9429597.1 hypothetical protein MSHRCOH1_05235 [Candidatus Ornithobacterium hominis]
MKNLFFTFAFMLIGTFTFASNEVEVINQDSINSKITKNLLSEKKDNKTVCSWCVKSGESMNCATAKDCSEARKIALAMAIDELG